MAAELEQKGLEIKNPIVINADILLEVNEAKKNQNYLPVPQNTQDMSTPRED